jgi:hypothetical protein
MSSLEIQKETMIEQYHKVIEIIQKYIQKVLNAKSEEELLGIAMMFAKEAEALNN